LKKIVRQVINVLQEYEHTSPEIKWFNSAKTYGMDKRTGLCYVKVVNHNGITVNRIIGQVMHHEFNPLTDRGILQVDMYHNFMIINVIK